MFPALSQARGYFDLGVSVITQHLLHIYIKILNYWALGKQEVLFSFESRCFLEFVVAGNIAETLGKTKLAISVATSD